MVRVNIIKFHYSSTEIRMPKAQQTLIIASGALYPLRLVLGLFAAALAELLPLPFPAPCFSASIDLLSFLFLFLVLDALVLVAGLFQYHSTWMKRMALSAKPAMKP